MSPSRAKNIRSCKETPVGPSIHEPSLVRRGQLCFRANSDKVSEFILCTHGRSHMKLIKGKVHQFCCGTCSTSSIARRRGRFQNNSSVVSCRLRVVCVSVFNYFRKPTFFPTLPEIPLTATLSKARWTHPQGWTGLGEGCI